MKSRIQSYLRFAASKQRDTQQIGSFLATFNVDSDNPFLNYAIPDDNAIPSSADVNALISAYKQRLRIPRLEYITQLAPSVEGALLAAGSSRSRGTNIHTGWLFQNWRNTTHFLPKCKRLSSE